MSFRKSSSLLRLAVGFVAGSAAGWTLHDNQEKFPWIARSNGDEKDRKFWSWTATPKFKPSALWDDNWDQRDPKFLEESRKKHQLPRNTEAVRPGSATEIKKPTATRNLFLIRHGQYDVDGATDSARILTALGTEQAEFTGQRLNELNFPYTSLVHSSMTRARQTADAIRKLIPEVPVVECDLLREGAPCPPEPPLRNWRPDYKDGARIEAAFRKYFHRADPTQKQDSYEIIVCHANVIRYFVCRALQLPPEAWLRISLNHGSITWITIRPTGRVVLRALGDVGYMAPEKVSVV